MKNSKLLNIYILNLLISNLTFSVLKYINTTKITLYPIS